MGFFLAHTRGPTWLFVTVVPLHSMIREALKNLRDAREDGDPAHKTSTCSGACIICSNQRALDRLIDRLPREKA